jgi:CDGSH-type Zn-finger protein
MPEPRKHYTGQAVDVSFDPLRCRHAAECLRGGPVLLRGDLHITAPSGREERETRAALCSCGSTANAPYCDGSGTCGEWPHPQTKPSADMKVS